ncbi:hypothetical protein BSIN_4426 [Burkholderia singularis]|uniref:Uncharacterized protein n=1 Tax=Burkholderia singularis TaxID=1503053 RepID=A0A238H885_9BURK|nr:hypothetical protein BSIN_4426 [Burkholderia singularis]
MQRGRRRARRQRGEMIDRRRHAGRCRTARRRQRRERARAEADPLQAADQHLEPRREPGEAARHGDIALDREPRHGRRDDLMRGRDGARRAGRLHGEQILRDRRDDADCVAGECARGKQQACLVDIQQQLADRRAQRRHVQAEADLGARERRLRVDRRGEPQILQRGRLRVQVRRHVGREHEEKRVARVDLGCHAVEIDGVDHVRAGHENAARLRQRRPVLEIGERFRGRDHLRAGRARRQRVPDVARVEIGRGLVELRQLPGGRHALRARAGWQHATKAGGDGKREPHARRDAGPRPVADQPRQLEHRAAFERARQIAFVRVARLIERQHVGDDRPRVDERDAWVRRLACREPRERAQRVGAAAIGRRHVDRQLRQPCEHGVVERRIATCAAAQRRTARRVELPARHACRVGAAA